MAGIELYLDGPEKIEFRRIRIPFEGLAWPICLPSTKHIWKIQLNSSSQLIDGVVLCLLTLSVPSASNTRVSVNRLDACGKPPAKVNLMRRMGQTLAT